MDTGMCAMCEWLVRNAGAAYGNKALSGGVVRQF